MKQCVSKGQTCSCHTEGLHHADQKRPRGTKVKQSKQPNNPADWFLNANHLKLNTDKQKVVVKEEDALSFATYRLQLVHEFDQELAALWSLAVQLHAGLHGIESTCGMERASHEHLQSKK